MSDINRSAVSHGKKRLIVPKQDSQWDPAIEHIEIALVKDSSGSEGAPKHYEVWNHGVYLGRVTSKINPRSLQFAAFRYWETSAGPSPEELVTNKVNTRSTQEKAIKFLLYGR